MDMLKFRAVQLAMTKAANRRNSAVDESPGGTSHVTPRDSSSTGCEPQCVFFHESCLVLKHPFHGILMTFDPPWCQHPFHPTSRSPSCFIETTGAIWSDMMVNCQHMMDRYKPAGNHGLCGQYVI